MRLVILLYLWAFLALGLVATVFLARLLGS
jgi:hypothetical protein